MFKDGFRLTLDDLTGMARELGSAKTRLYESTTRMNDIRQRLSNSGPKWLVDAVSNEVTSGAQALTGAAEELGRYERGVRDRADQLLRYIDPPPKVSHQRSAPSRGGEATPIGPTGQDIVHEVHKYLGVPYVWGGATPSGFDCSGLVMYVFAKFGYKLPHYTGDQVQKGCPIPSDKEGRPPLAELQPGDILFFNTEGKDSHVGIYIGNGQMIEAPHTGDVVKTEDITSGYYREHYDCARRIIGCVKRDS
jgi:cell wall-associated NlpC family hydrolase